MSGNKKQKGKKVTKAEKKSRIISGNHIFWLSGILIITIIAYSGMFQNQITNFDDQAYVTENPLVQNPSFEHIGKMFSESYYGGYYPLTLLSFAIDVKLGGDDPTKMLHFTNLFLHLLNIILLWWLLWLLFRNLNIAVVAVLLFGVHSLHVESVAWISERKDVLYTFFYLLSLICYVRYIELSKPKFYILTFLFFFLSIISKTMGVSLAITLFALDYLLGKKITDKKLLIEKIPFVVMAIFFGIVSIWSQKSIGIITEENQLGIFEKIIYASYGFTVYLAKLVFPFKLSAFYPYPQTFSFAYVLFLIPALAYVFVIVLMIRKNRTLAFGMLFFLINIALVLQILQINNFIVADRFTYVASIGIFLLAGYGYDRLVKWKPSYKNVLIGAMVFYALLLTFMTSARCKDWKDSESLWTDMIQKYPDRIPKAYYFRGHVYAEKKLYGKALKDFDKVVAMEPVYYLPMAHHSRATTYANMGKIDQALEEINVAIALDTANISFYSLRAQINMNTGRMAQARSDYDKMIQLKPNDYVAYYYRAMFYAQTRNFDQALKDFDKILELNPELAEAYLYRGRIRWQLNMKNEACSDFQTANDMGIKEARSMLSQYCQEIF